MALYCEKSSKILSRLKFCVDIFGWRYELFVWKLFKCANSWSGWAGERRSRSWLPVGRAADEGVRTGRSRSDCWRRTTGSVARRCRGVQHGTEKNCTKTPCTCTCTIHSNMNMNGRANDPAPASAASSSSWRSCWRQRWWCRAGAWDSRARVAGLPPRTPPRSRVDRTTLQSHHSRHCQPPATETNRNATNVELEEILKPTPICYKTNAENVWNEFVLVRKRDWWGSVALVNAFAPIQDNQQKK